MQVESVGGCSVTVRCPWIHLAPRATGTEMPSMAASHGGILYYVVKVPKETRWVTAVSIERNIFVIGLVFYFVRVCWMGLPSEIAVNNIGKVSSPVTVRITTKHVVRD